MGKGRRILGALAGGLYLVVTRTLLVVAVLVPSLYFVLNSSPFPGQLTRFLRSVLPGSLEFGSIQISPIPWKVDILDVAIRAPDGEAVIRAGTVRVSVDLVPLVRFLSGEDPEIVVHLPDIQLFDYEALIDFDAETHLKLVDAFHLPDPNKPPSTGPGQSVRLVFDHITGERGSCRVSFPYWDIRVEGIRLQARLGLQTQPSTRVKVEAARVTWTHGVGHIRAAPGVSAIPREVPMGPGGVDGFVFDWDRISYRQARFAFPGMDLDSRDGFLAWSENLRYEGVADLDFADGSPLTDTATGGLAKGPLRLHVDGRGDHFDPRFSVTVDSPSLAFAGFDLGRVEAAVTGGRDETGRYAFQGIRAFSDSRVGRIRLDGGVFHPFGSADGIATDTTFAIEAEGLDLPGFLAELGAPVPGLPAPLPRSVSGRLQVRADVVSWATRIAFGRVAGTLAALLPDGTLLAGPDASIRLDASLAVSGDFARPQVDIAALELGSGADAALLKGSLDLGRRELDVTGSVAKDLRSLLPVIGLKGRGQASLADLRVHGPLANPVATASAAVTGLSVGPWEADQARARLDWRDGILTVSALDAATPYGPVAASRVAVRLVDPATWQVSSPHLSIAGGASPALDLARLPLPKDLGLKGKVDLAVERLELDLRDPLGSMDGTARATAARMVAAGRPLTDVQARVQSGKGGVAKVQARAALKAGGTATVEGTVDLPKGTFQATLDGKGLSLPGLAGMKKDGALKGMVDVQAAASGPLRDPGLDARIDASEVAYGDQRFGDLSVIAARVPGGDLHLSSDRFLPRMHLNEDSRITWSDGRFDGLVVMVDLNRVTPQDLWPSIRARDLWGQLTGNVQVRMGFGPGGTLQAALTSPPDGLRLDFLDREVRLRNVEKLVAAIEPDGSVSLRGLALYDGRGTLRACGHLLDKDGRMRLWAKGRVGAYWLREFGQVFSVADGYVRLAGTPGALPADPPPGCGTEMAEDPGPLEVHGTLARPLADGEVRLGAVELGIRGLGEALRLQDGGRVLLSSGDGRMRATIPADGWVKGSLGEGKFTVHGNAAFDGLVPADGEVVLEGADLRFVSPGEYFLVGNPSVTATFEGLGAPGQSRMRIGGRVALTDGSYHRNFDIVGKAFSGLTGTRVAERQGRSLEEVAPWLADADLDLAVTGPRFGVRSKLPVGSTDFDIAMDLRVKGKVKAPELWNRVEVLPGGTVTYEVVRRVFEVVRGTVDFDGPPGQPRVDVLARTRIQVVGTTTQSTAVASRFDPDAPVAGALDQGIQVSLKVTGRYPDLDISLSSTSKAYTQTELQYLVLTGSLPQGGVASSAGQIFNLGLLTEDVTNLVAKLLLGSLVDAINLGVSPTGGVNVDVMAHLGSRMRFATQVQQNSGSAWYTAGFHVRLTDYLSLEGRVLSISQALDRSQEGNKYETKLRLRIPID